MDDVPLHVTILIPSSVARLRGRFSTTFPYGALMSVRLPHAAIEAIDRARKLADPDLSRSLFIRMAAVRMAEAIIEHHDAYLRTTSNERDRDD
jgi:hypothetical protein